MSEVEMGEVEMRARLITEARDWIGTSYLHRASLKGQGADCLGLIRGVWRAVVGPEPQGLPAYAPDWAEATKAEQMAEAAGRHMRAVALEAIAPGDVLLFRWRAGFPAKHAALLVSGERMASRCAACGGSRRTRWRRSTGASTGTRCAPMTCRPGSTMRCSTRR